MNFKSTSRAASVGGLVYSCGRGDRFAIAALTVIPPSPL
jgi:hypothetical protein